MLCGVQSIEAIPGSEWQPCVPVLKEYCAAERASVGGVECVSVAQ